MSKYHDDNMPVVREEMIAVWERLDTLEEMINFLYDKLDIAYVEGEEEVVEGGDA